MKKKIVNLLIIIGFVLFCVKILKKENTRDGLISYLESVNDLTLNLGKIDVEESLEIILKDSKFENQYQINKPPIDSFLNLYFLDVHSNNTLLTNFKGNCSYLGYKNIIICDQQFFDDFLIEKNIILYLKGIADSDAAIKEAMNMFFIWVIGHEFGHLTLNHSPSHFGVSEFESEVSNSKLDHRYELQADSFLVSKIMRVDGLDLKMSKLVINLLNIEIESKVGYTPPGMLLHFDYTNKKMIEYTSRKSHPEYVIRAIRILKLISEQNGDALIGYMIEKLIETLKKEGTAPNMK